MVSWTPSTQEAEENEVRLVYLGEQEDEGKEEGKGLNRPTSNGLVLQSANLQGKGRRAHARPNGQGRGRVIRNIY
jgi:hypothetical protein